MIIPVKNTINANILAINFKCFFFVDMLAKNNDIPAKRKITAVLNLVPYKWNISPLNTGILNSQPRITENAAMIMTKPISFDIFL
ncbi:MAG: hypothetical protein Kow0019_12660 [Methanobacteriaceae archaeon]